MKKFLLFFPDNSELRKHWWHRFFIVISYLWLTVIGGFGLLSLLIGSINIGYDHLRVRENLKLRGEIEDILKTKNVDTIGFMDRAYQGGYSYKEILEFAKKKNEGSPVTIRNKRTGDEKSIPVEELPQYISPTRNTGDTGIKLKFDDFVFSSGVGILSLAAALFAPAVLYRTFLFIVLGESKKSR